MKQTIFSEKQPAKEFSSGPQKPDIDKMYSRLKEFMKYSKKAYPNTILEGINFDFTFSDSIFVNSNGVKYSTNKGIYTVVVMFTTKEGKKTSSFNYVVYLSKNLENQLKIVVQSTGF